MEQMKQLRQNTVNYEETYTGTLKSKDELLGMGYSEKYVDNLTMYTNEGRKFIGMIKTGTSGIYEITTSDAIKLCVVYDAMSEIVKDTPQKFVTKYAKGKLVSKNELITLGVTSSLINVLLTIAEANAGFVPFRCTSKDDIVVVADGWTVSTDVFDFMAYDIEAQEENADVVSEPAESILGVTPSLTIPEQKEEPLEASDERYEAITLSTGETINVVTKEQVIEALSDTEEVPFKMSNSLFQKCSRIKNKTHYVKLQLKDEDLSFRFHYTFDDRPWLQNKWTLKSHRASQIIEVTEKFVKKHFEDVIGVVEIFGETVHKRGYQKIVRDLVTQDVSAFKEGRR